MQNVESAENINWKDKYIKQAQMLKCSKYGKCQKCYTENNLSEIQKIVKNWKIA